MALFYSASRAAFLDDELSYGCWPADAVPVTAAEHGRLMLAQADGQMIMPGPGGRPVAVQASPAPRVAGPGAARAALQASDVIVLRCLERGIAVPADWIAYRDALRAIVAGEVMVMPERPASPAGLHTVIT